MKVKSSFLLFIFLSTFSFSQTDSLALLEDEILQKIELGNPIIPSLRFKDQYVYPIGKWCTIGYDSVSWELSKVASNSLMNQCNGISFKLNGELEEHINANFIVFDKRRTNFIARDSILEITVIKKDSTRLLEQYVVEHLSDQRITLKLVNVKELKTKSFTPIFGNSEDAEHIVIIADGKKLTYSKSKCTMVCCNAVGDVIWEDKLNTGLCKIIHIKPLKKPVKGCQVVFQTNNKKIYLLNLNNGKTKGITMKQFEKIGSK